MAGLLSDPRALDQTDPGADPNAPDPAGGGAPAPPADPNASTVPDDQGEQATPEEQAKYEEFVKTGYEMMYAGGKVNPGVMKMLDNDPSDLIEALGNGDEFKQFSPLVALAATAAIITLKVCEKTGEKDGVIILHGGKAIMEDLVEVAGKAGIKDYSEEEMNQAFHMGADLFRHTAEQKGLLDMGQAKQEWGEITAADKAGTLGDLIPPLKPMTKLEASMQPGQQQPDPNAVPPVDPNAGGANAP